MGFFVNMLVLRVDCSAGRSFRDYLAHVKQVNLEAQENQDVPFEYLVEMLKPRRSASHAPLVQIVFSMNPNEVSEVQLTALTLTPMRSERAAVKFDLILDAMEEARGLRLSFAYNRDLFDATSIARLGEHFKTLLRGVVANPDGKIETQPLLTEAELRHLLYGLNGSAKDYQSGICVHELFERQVEQTPEATAVVYEDQSLSYAELNAHANRLAHYLLSLGVKPGQRVAICMERSLGMVIGMLAILKAGGAYVPLDPAYPSGRLQQILSDAAPQMVLSDGAGRRELGEKALRDVTVLELDELGKAEVQPPQWAGQSEGNPDAQALGLRSHNLAYVIYTSGSTGTPKGVMVEHRGVVNFLRSMAVAPGITAQDRLLAVTSISFDIAGLELYLPLSHGAQIVVASRWDSVDPYELQRLMEEHGITMMQATPATWRALLDAQWKPPARLKILCGGEALPAALAARLAEQGESLWNLYGPTETTIWSACVEIETRWEKCDSACLDRAADWEHADISAG